MDRALLERMVGAVVLVLLFVVFVPALLDGRDAEPEDAAVSGAGKGTRTAVIVLNEASQPEMTPEEPIMVAPASPQPVAAAEPESEPEPMAEPAPEPVREQEAPTAKVLPQKAAAKPRQAPSEGFAVQLGSFGSKDNATGFAGSIRDAGYPVFIIRAWNSGKSVYRVYVGPEPTRPEAEKLAARLQAAGQSVMVVDLGGLANG